jgi:hypothetical protein
VPDQSTVRERALAAGISPERLERHFTERCLRLNGEVVTDLDQPTEPEARITVWGS